MLSKEKVVCDMRFVLPLLSELSGAELKLYLWFVNSTNNGKHPCQDTRAEIVAGSGIAQQTLTTAIKKLVSDKYISRKARSAKKPVIKLLKPLK